MPIVIKQSFEIVSKAKQIKVYTFVAERTLRQLKLGICVNYHMLISACGQGLSGTVLNLIKMSAIQAVAGDNDNEALNLVCANGMAEAALGLIELAEVQDNLANNHNEALESACGSGLSKVALKLLSIKAVQENAAINNNTALRLACDNGLSEVALKLLQIKKVQEQVSSLQNIALSLSNKEGLAAVASKLQSILKTGKDTNINPINMFVQACQKQHVRTAFKWLEDPKVFQFAVAETNHVNYVKLLLRLALDANEMTGVENLLNKSKTVAKLDNEELYLFLSNNFHRWALILLKAGLPYLPNYDKSKDNSLDIRFFHCIAASANIGILKFLQDNTKQASNKISYRQFVWLEQGYKFLLKFSKPGSPDFKPLVQSCLTWCQKHLTLLRFDAKLKNMTIEEICRACTSKRGIKNLYKLNLVGSRYRLKESSKRDMQFDRITRLAQSLVEGMPLKPLDIQRFKSLLNVICEEIKTERNLQSSRLAKVLSALSARLDFEDSNEINHSQSTKSKLRR